MSNKSNVNCKKVKNNCGNVITHKNSVFVIMLYINSGECSNV